MESFLSVFSTGMAAVLVLCVYLLLLVLIVLGALKLVLSYFGMKANTVVVVSRSRLEDKLRFASNPEEVFNELFQGENDTIIVKGGIEDE